MQKVEGSVTVRHQEIGVEWLTIFNVLCLRSGNEQKWYKQNEMKRMSSWNA